MLVNALYLTGDFKLALCSATIIIQLHGGKIFLKIIYFFFSQDNLVIVHHQASKVISSYFLTDLLFSHHSDQFQYKNSISYSQYYYSD